MTELQKTPWPDWEIVRLIGRGAFGTVYEIQRKLINEDAETAALKVITIPQNPSDIDEMRTEGYDDASISETFNGHLKNIVSEYSLMRKMDGSANIVNCKDIFYIQHDDGFGWDIYIRMELLTPLMTFISGEIAEETVIKIGRDICKALMLCKKYEIAHRDIKPQNIFISQNGDYKLGDFGIAKKIEQTMSGTRIGTFKYMAPEVYNNQPYSSTADIYSLGLVLYWLLNERRSPFMPLTTVKFEIGQDELARQRRLLGEKIPEPAHGSSELKRIVIKACAYDPKDRYATAAEMLNDLNRLEKENAAVDISGVVDDNYTEITDDERTPVEEKTVCLLENDLTLPIIPDANSKRIINTELPVLNVSDIRNDSKEKNKTKKFLIGTVALLSVILCSISMLFIPWYGEWSDWSETNPKKNSDYKIESKEQYRNRTKTLFETTEESVENGVFVSQREGISDFGSWSDWQTTPVTADDNCKVESKIQYRSRKKSTEKGWSDWSAWGDWTTTPATNTDSCKVKTRTVYLYDAFRYKCDFCENSFGEINLAAFSQIYQLHRQEVSQEAIDNLYNLLKGRLPPGVSKEQVIKDAGYTYQTKILYGIESKLELEGTSAPYKIEYEGSSWYVLSSEPTKTETQYSTQTREMVEAGGWSEWSEFSDKPISVDSNTQVEQCELYRFCTREMTTLYTFEVWKEWSEWGEEPISLSENQEQEQRTVYRYKQRRTLWDKWFG